MISRIPGHPQLGAALSILLMFGPLAAYLATIGLRQAGRRPRVVSGPLDSAFLGFALGALLAFGPVGRALTAGLRSNLVTPVLLCALGLFLMILSARSRRRLMIYNADAPAVDRGLRLVLDALPGDYQRTLRGFEDRNGGRGLRVEASASYRTAEVEAFGEGPEPLIAAIEPALRRALAIEVGPGGWSLSRFWLSLASLTLTAPWRSRSSAPEDAGHLAGAPGTALGGMIGFRPRRAHLGNSPEINRSSPGRRRAKARARWLNWCLTRDESSPKVRWYSGMRKRGS